MTNEELKKLAADHHEKATKVTTAQMQHTTLLTGILHVAAEIALRMPEPSEESQKKLEKKVVDDAKDIIKTEGKVHGSL